jgi:Bifunctional DNA primase/polymerase, N-terminal/Family of unknown function (DUF5906)/Primase C terminal 2 (PriCT-2)
MMSPNTWDPLHYPLHRAVLNYIRNGWPIIPLWWMDGQRCACGKLNCGTSSGKHPIRSLVPHGIKNASLDQSKVIAWWTRCPQANIGIALGRASGLVVVDVDGPLGRELLERLLSIYEFTLNTKWFVETGRADGGRHYYFKYPVNGLIHTKKVKGLELRSDGTYVVGPPSTHYSGHQYLWHNILHNVPDELPECFASFAARGERIFSETAPNSRLRSLKPVKSKLTAQSGFVYSPPAWSESEERRILDALQAIPADDREFWLCVGMALHWTGWDRARLIWDQWSEKSLKFDIAGQEKAWKSFGRADYPGPFVTLGSLFDLAKRYGYAPQISALTEAEKSPECNSVIEEINERHFLIRNIGGKCMVGEMVTNPAGSGQMLSLQSVDAFRTWYANRFVAVRDSQGNTKPKPIGAYWLQHRDRRGYEGVDLVPNAPKELPNGNLNLWRGFGVEPKQGRWTLMLRHVCHVLAGGDKKAAEYILRWAGWSVQHPGERAEVALVFQGGKGCGKGVFVRAVATCFGEHGIQITNQEHLIGRFNGHLRSCLFLFADEAFWAGNKKGESVLKGLITEPSLMIEQKGIDPIQWPNRLHVMMAANSDWVVPASAGERRYAVFKCADTHVRGRGDEAERGAYFEALHHELENAGLNAMLHDLLNWGLGDWHPRQVYETDALRQQKEQSLSPVEEWFVEVLEEGKLPGAGGIARLSERRDFASTRALVEDAKLRVPRSNGWLSDKGMAVFLRKHGCISEKERRGGCELRGWRFPPLAQIRQAWSRLYGGWEWPDPEQRDWQ